jgi:REP element-mobilizing transposase RayT
MGSTFYSLHHHVIFSTKHRRPLIKANWRADLHQYLGGAVRGLGGVAEIVGGVEDHVHLLIGLKTTDAPADFLRELKKSSSVWAADHHEPQFGWQEGYGIFSVSWTHRASLARYIENQEEHHRRVSFLDEFKRLLKRNGVAYERAWLE